ncbi:MAG: hypothetical protein UU65_C0001G0210 [candidate division CPR2 bacterium GW2011_GWC1_41_48]|uniref:Uncharacterized protein n=1 Tax=candidate division CPR2 bacterium GW2011_GWC1_41_48 TaxID=1618344 RepID=A0A0G0WA08_UNCC2|nr:MAG: hypothetical protein UT47_C0001G0210 [candidate division CPR2 bacterium GW2011_GWC2_39_35]KKR28093.1 MAG: hypothetical protein UT59_C0035G0003 [candidate division CPR2 bacterium GW2011_GWD1_39_7]KKR28137.1 MAG: hypothetical protein UT60_C0027G0027 [candidate division CPR2 bacterium GW2011_GWD2_39_7]KKS09805.1 MAG: hypothetical protein UU65_C0001G0210 [candidate division CPR2 bacterium GW2011_GWC1_41_48]
MSENADNNIPLDMSGPVTIIGGCGIHEGTYDA